MTPDDRRSTVPPGGFRVRRRAAAGLAALAALAVAPACDRLGAEPELPPVAAAPTAPDRVAALGRLEPEDGIRRIAGPSGVSAVISELRVDEGERIEEGQVIAVLDTAPVLRADIARLQAELANARNENARHTELNASRVVSDSQREQWETRLRVIEAQLVQARAELARAVVRAPIDGQVLLVNAREGELVGAEGIVELGRTDHMFAIAEVWEEEVGRVRPGQRARVTSPAFEGALQGTVEWVQLKVAKNDAIGTDPAARKDARVVEVEIRLDDSATAARFTHLQVEIEIDLQDVARVGARE